FFFQAEDGIRDGHVTGVQTCALPILAVWRPIWLLDEPTSALDVGSQRIFAGLMEKHLARGGMIVAATHSPLGIEARELLIGGAEIGRASCRERGEVRGAGGSASGTGE